MKYQKFLNRRTLLLGAGGVIVGLPFLDEMRVSSLFAAEPEPPIRAFNLFFGLGYQRALQNEGFVAPNGWISPLEPMLAHESKLAFLRNVNQIRADGDGNAHYDGSSGAFTGTRMANKSTTGGASLDEALRRSAYPNGMPAGVLRSLSAGTWWRRSDSTCRYVHSRNPDGSAVEIPLETPKSLFQHIFGGFAPEPEDPMAPDVSKAAAMKASVLDSLVGQYQHYQSDAGNLGKASRAKIADHLDHIRALELQAGEMPSIKENCAIPTEPSNSMLPHGAPKDGDGTQLTNDGDGIDITLEQLTGEFRIMADLYAMAVRCDRARFGSLVFQSGGERIRLKGEYVYNNTTHSFDDRTVRGRGGALGCSHEYWHAFSDNGENKQVRAHLHLMMREHAYFLSLLDGIIDENSQSVLDNAMITVSTESGDGRHQSAAFELNGVFHAISSGNGRLRVGNGDFIDVDDHATAVYNTMLRSYDVQELLGDEQGDLTSIRA